MTAKPQHRARGHVEDHRNEREHHHEKPADVQGQAGDVFIFLGKALGLIGLAHEGTHHADAGDLLAQGAIDGIQLVLHGTEERHEAGNDNGDGAEQNRHGHPHQPGHSGVFAHGHDDAADGHDGCGHHEVQHHHVDHLHLLDVIGAAGNERRRAKAAHVLSGQGINVSKNLAAQIPADTHGGAAAAPDCANSGDDLGKRDGQHDAAGAPDEVHIALRHTFIDDLGIKRWKVQRGSC